MATIIGVALIVLGLAIGFILAWAFKVGTTMNLFVGVLLVVAGGIIGYVIEWIIDEAYRKNRELRQRLGQPGAAALDLGASVRSQGDDSASGTLADFLRQRDQEVHELRDQLSSARSDVAGLRDEFEVYQRTHPDSLTVIKGIGPVYQWKLRDAGVNTYAQLAAANPEQLRRMLDVKNWQRVNVESWIEQARDWAQRGR